MVDLQTRFVASMVLSGTADALGYNQGEWEFCTSGKQIHKEVAALGGIDNIDVAFPEWIVSDDTVMHLATGDALVSVSGADIYHEQFCRQLATEYIKCMRDMDNRAPGLTCMGSVAELCPGEPDGCRVPFNPSGGGCGAAMRAMCIGLRYSDSEHVDDLMAVSIEAGRMTHHHPTGFLGSLVSALFTSYAVQDKPPRSWGAGLMDVLPRAKEYIKGQARFVEENIAAWDYFTDAWNNYLKSRGISDGRSDPVFPPDYGIEVRDDVYFSLSYGKWAGSSGHDAPMIAYDAILASGSSWHELCARAVFHGGDSDSTGAIAGAWFGALHGFEGVPENNFKRLEYRERLEKVGQQLYQLSNTPKMEDEPKTPLD